MTETSRHPPYHASSHQQYYQDIITTSQSYIVQTRPDIVILPISITQTSTHHHCHTDINTTSLPHRHRDTIINTQTSTQHNYHGEVNTLSSINRPSTQHDYHTDINTPSLSHRHQHNITATQASRHNHQQADINTQSLSHKRQHNFPVTQSYPARFYILSAIFSLSRIVVAKINMWGYHGFSGPRLKFFSCLNFKHGFFTFFTTCLARRASPPSP